jgi:hypothetical protein
MVTLTDPFRRGWKMAAPELTAIVRDVIILVFVLISIDVVNIACQLSLLGPGDPDFIHNVELGHKWVAYSGLIVFVYVGLLRSAIVIRRETKRAMEEMKK